MPEDKKSAEKSLEMRVAELEDKLSKIHITEDEMKAYQKVSSLLGGGHAAQPDPTASLSPQVCVIPRSITPRSIHPPCIINPCIINRGFCYECSCGPCGGFGGGFGGGGFGGFGM